MSTTAENRLCRRTARGGRGLTLVELLLVCAIIAIVTAVSMPLLARSIRGNRLRTACRTVVLAGRYARSMAVLRQREMIVSFDLQAARVTVAPGGPPPAAPAAATATATETDAPPATAEAQDGAGETAPAATAAAGGAELARELEGVKLTFVELLDQRRDEGTARVVYSANGRCPAYRVGLQDQDGAATVVEVDELSSARIRAGSL